MAFHATDRRRHLLAIALAAGFALASGVASAQGRSTPRDPARLEPSEALRKRLAENRYFEIVQNSLRVSPPAPVPMVIPPRLR